MMKRKSKLFLFRIEYNINEKDISLDLYLPENELKKNYLNNFKKCISFKCNEIFNDTSQEELYEKLGPEVIERALNGYNNTILCYGQTSSGKTYTMSGGKSWKERGIIPRLIVDLFNRVEVNSDYEIYISYLEIYNENGYDLLDSKLKNNTDIEKWSKIVVYEDNNNNIIVKNMKSIKVTSDKDALDLFMSGNYYRQVSSTPQNMASSRSHAIFTINIIKKIGDKIVSSKINLVDLAGSERLNKSSLMQSSIYNTFENYGTLYFSDVPQLINETKSINLSLSFLEQVITALNEKVKNKQYKHIPYRNSLMTTLLKDSLGGNCKTILIANISMDINNLDETISTLRFMSRCSKIENEVVINYEVDSNILIDNLKNENLLLREKINNLERQRINKSMSNINLNKIRDTTEIFDKTKTEKIEGVKLLKNNNGLKNKKLIENIQNQKSFDYMKPLEYIPLNEKEKLNCSKMIDNYVTKYRENLSIQNIDNYKNNRLKIDDFLKVYDNSELFYMIELLVEYINTKDLSKEVGKKETKPNNKITNLSSLLKN